MRRTPPTGVPTGQSHERRSPRQDCQREDRVGFARCAPGSRDPKRGPPHKRRDKDSFPASRRRASGRRGRGPAPGGVDRSPPRRPRSIQHQRRSQPSCTRSHLVPGRRPSALPPGPHRSRPWSAQPAPRSGSKRSRPGRSFSTALWAWPESGHRSVSRGADRWARKRRHRWPRVARTPAATGRAAPRSRPASSRGRVSVAFAAHGCRPDRCPVYRCTWYRPFRCRQGS